MILNSEKYFKSQKIMDMFKVTQLDVADMSVHINSGTIIYNNQVINFSEQDSEILQAPRIGTWLVVLSINSKGEIVYTYGVQSTEEKRIPKLPEDCFHLCIIEINASTVMITQDLIYDLRNVFNFSSTQEMCCTYKCGLESDYSFTSEDRKQLKEFYDKYEALSAEIDKLKLMFNPKQEYHVLSDGGIEYIIRFKDDGTPYFTRADAYNDNPSEDNKNTHTDYKFVYNADTVNIVTESCDDFVKVAVKIKSFDSLNNNLNCTLYVRCDDTTIFSSNYMPHYQENEFKITNLELNKSGFYEMFAFKFHNNGNHTMNLALYDNNTKQLLDKAKIGYDVEFKNNNIE